MKTSKTIIVALLGLALASGLLIAAADSTPASAAPAVPDPSPGKLRDRIIEKLGLTPEQQKKIDALRAERNAALAALQDNKDLVPDARRQKAGAIIADYQGRMLAELTPEQQEKAKAWRGRMDARRHEDGRGGPPPRAGGPGQPGLMPRNPLALVAMGEKIKDRIAEKLQLTDEQRDKLEHLGRAYRAQQRAAMKQHLEDMRAILTPEQQKKVDAWKEHRPGGPGGPGHGPRFGMDDEPGPEGLMVAGGEFNPDDELPDGE